MPLTKNVGVPETPLRSALSTSSAIRPATVWRRRSSENGRRRGRARPRSRSDPAAQSVLVVEQQVVHLPEAALRRRRPRSPRRRAGRAGGRRSAAGAARRSEDRPSRRAARGSTGSAWPQNGHSRSPYSTSVTGASAGPRMWSRSGSTGTARSISSSGRTRAARGSAARVGSRAVARKRSQVERRGDEPRAEDAELRLGERRRRGTRGSAIRSETVNPIPAMKPPPATAAQPTGGRSAAAAQLRHEPRGAGDPDRLPERRSRGGSRASPARCRPARRKRSVDRDPGVREREQRHDHVARPGMEELLEPLVRRDRRLEADRWRCARARGSAARGRAGRGRSRARGRSARGGEAYVISPIASPTTIGSIPDCVIATHAPDAEQRGRRGRRGPRRGRASQTTASTPIARPSAPEAIVGRVDGRDHDRARRRRRRRRP